MISLRGISVDVSGFTMPDVSLDIGGGEYFILLGPTGAGKTILLETIAGLHPVSQGSIVIDGVDVTCVRPERRGIGIVYQDQALFPHMSVRSNVSFGLRVRGFPAYEQQARLERVVEMTSINHLLDRSPSGLSGGERQRVALARALVVEPSVLLLDEPLSALDPPSRESLRRELAAVHSRSNVTVVHVTHDLEEAASLGQRVAVVNEGSVAQVGTIDEILRKPNSEFVARFSLARNVIPGRVVENERGLALIEVGSGVAVRAETPIAPGVEAMCFLRAEDILLTQEAPDSAAPNVFAGRVAESWRRGPVVYVELDVPLRFTCLVSAQAADRLDLRQGNQVWLSFGVDAVHAIERRR